ncbi:MAG: Uma2 family endonuclease [Pseudanabaena sp. SU_2_4]|nr:Uma2 family endonuclease [Pseudanabaena sp. SU_2_4]
MLADIRQITVQEFHQMFEAGILDDSEHVELIAGQIIKMAAKGTPHRATVTRIWKLLETRLGNEVLACPQEPVQLNDYSEPEPDIAVLRPDPLYYEEHHPIPADIYLVIEVADTTLKKDCELKAIAYAQSGIADYWVLDIKARQLHIFRDPDRNGYLAHEILSERERISLIAFPTVNLDVREMLSPLA